MNLRIKLISDRLNIFYDKKQFENLLKYNMGYNSEKALNIHFISINRILL